MAFYVLFAVGLLAPRRWIGVLAAVAALAAAVLWGQAVRPASQTLGFYTTPMVLEFGAGMVLGLAWPRLNLSRRFAWPLGLVILAAFLLMLGGPWLWPRADRLLAFGVPATTIVAAALALERQGRAVRWRWLLALGAASYAIYLSHFFVTQAVTLGARRAGLHGPWEAAAAAAAAFLGVALVGLALHHTLEQGADRLIGRLLRAREPRSSEAEPAFAKVKSVS
jgi:peptidoglycan/LPS O-acetylase OafA/YrhL